MIRFLARPKARPTVGPTAGPKARWRARWKVPLAAGAAVAMALLALLSTTSPASAGSYVTLSGSGSSWASVGLQQWAQDLEPDGLTVNFNPDGSAAGRGDFMEGSQVDFAASDPPFRDGEDELAGTGAEIPQYGYSYVPDESPRVQLFRRGLWMELKGGGASSPRMDPSARPRIGVS
jgi:hypothetical protein